MTRINLLYNKVSGLLLLAMLLLAAIPSAGQTKENVLVVNDFEGTLGKPISVPVYLENSDDVVAAQFDIELPFATPGSGTCILSNRSDGHSVSFSSVGTKTYRVVIMTMENRPLLGNAGLLLRMPMQAYDDGQTATPYPVKITNVVLTDAQGNNIATSNTATGNFIVSYDDVPDLTVQNIVPQTTQCEPGGSISISYDVVNIGTGATRAGWTEKLYLESVNGTRTYIGSQTYESTLPANNTANRTYTATLPTLLHIDGDVTVYVEVVPSSNTGELLSDQGNNSALSATTINLSKRLFFTASSNTVREGSGYVTVTLSRSGDWSVAESFTVNCSVNGLLTAGGQAMPIVVTIPAHAASATLRIASVNDNIVRAREAELIVDAANGYNATTLTLKRTDDDLNPLTLSLSASSIAEGQSLKLTGTRGGELTDELTLNVSCTQANRFEQPFVLHFDAGQSVASVTVASIDDTTPHLDANVEFSASANDYKTAKVSLLLTDDDRPALTISLSVPSVMENIGTDADASVPVATITRDRGIEQPIEVWLTSSTNDIVFENNKVTIPAGSNQIEVPLSVVDNADVDGSHNITLTAALYLPAELRSAPVGDRACSQCQLTVNDDELPYLTLSSRVSAVSEGSSTTLTVKRYVVSTSEPLSVTISCPDSRISFNPQSVTIPAGSTTATTTMAVARNAEEGDDGKILVTASGNGVSDGLLELNITDRTLPDAVNPQIEVVEQQLFSGLTATVRATIRNIGTSTLPAGMKVNFYLASTSQLYYYTTTHNFFTATTDKEIAVGAEEIFEFNAQLPQLVGNWWIYARLNSDNQISEFSTSNNLTQVFCPITIAAPFEVETISATPEDCLAGDIITVKGRVKAVEGSYLNNQTVRVSLRGSGQQTTAETKIDAAGNFDVCIRVDRSAHGYMTVKALAVGQTEPAKTAQVHVYNMSLSADNNRWTVDENIELQGMLTLRNTSAKPITFTELITSQPLPEGAEIVFNTSSLGIIAANSAVTIPYTVKGAKVSNERQSFAVTAKTEEGLVSQVTISYYCQATEAYLTFSPKELTTTMLFNADRSNVTVKVKNTGKRESGNITEVITGDWVMSDFGNNRTLQPGEEATIHLTFLAQDNMHTGETYKSYLQLSPENGRTAVLPIIVTTTGNEYSQFDVYATDVYSKALGDYTHVAGAEVTVTNARTGSVVMTGTTDSEGHWSTNMMQQGLYDVTVKATRHKNVTSQVLVGPGEDSMLTVLLPYKAVLADFVVDQDLTDMTYTMKQYFNIDLDAPQGIVVAEIDDKGFSCDTEMMEITLRNVGSKTATNINLRLPDVAGCTFTMLNDCPSILQPGDVYVLQVGYNGPTEGTHRVIANLRLHYEFDIKGEILSEDDTYQTLVGCVQLSEDPEPLPRPEPSVDEEDDDDSHPGSSVALPSYNCFVKIVFEDLKNVRCGQPLNATLMVYNRQTEALRSLRFVPQISNTEYEDRTSFFTYEELGTSGLTNDGSYYQLTGNTEGTINLSFIPLARAAENGPTTYYIGGQLAYIDSRTNIRNSASLPIYEMTVQPSGDVSLTYLIQKNFLGDEVTTDDVEDQEPAVFAMLAHNLGAVDVTQLKLLADQPVVVGNNSAKAVPYTVQYAAVDGQTGNYTFTDFELESIAGGSTAAARWIYTSDVSAHVRSMEAITTGVSAATGSGASVIVNAPRELVRIVASRSITSGVTSDDSDELEMKVQALTEGDAYLLNDVDDEQRLPDAVMTSDGIEEGIQIVSSSSTIAKAGEVGDYTLTVHANAAGWIYGQLHDPTNGLMRLESVTRVSDNSKVSLANFWQSDRTPLADYTMLQENLLHYADQLNGTEETYLLHYVDRLTDAVKILDIQLYTAAGTQVEDGSITTEPVKKIVVEFTAPIRSFLRNLAVLTAHGEAQYLNDKPVQSDSEKRRWTLDVTELPEIPGEHVFTMTTDKLKSPTGKKVVGTETVSWTENLNGQALITINIAPNEEWGASNPGTGNLQYGIQEIEAIAAEGYQFERWTDATGTELLSESSTLELDVWKDQTLTAYFSPVTYNITINCESEGELKGYTSGIYDYKEEILLAAQPNSGYVFDCWMKNGKLFSRLQSTTDLADGNNTYLAKFRLAVVELDENGSTAPEATGGVVSVKVKRALKGGQWNTICLPFNMTADQLEDVFGSDVAIAAFKGYETEVVDGMVTGITVQFNEVSLSEGMNANYPYLIQPSKLITEFTVEADVIPDELGCVAEFDNGKTDAQRLVLGKFIGSYHAGTIVPINGLFLNGNKFWYSTGQIQMKAYHAYFMFEDVLGDTSGSGTRVELSIGSNSDATGIRTNHSITDEYYYDMLGRRVVKPGKGVFINNGKKTVIK